MRWQDVVMVLVLVDPRSWGFQPQGMVMRSRSLLSTCGDCDTWSPFSGGCEPCDDGSVIINGKTVTSKALRDVQVTSADGVKQPLLSTVTDASVVVFLRHLG